MNIKTNNLKACLFAALLAVGNAAYSQVSISGNIRTEDNEDIENVEVTLEGPGVSLTTMTDGNGDFLFSSVPGNQDYTVCAYKDTDPLNGVTTFDLVLINKHILNVEPFVSPHKIIAADVTDNQAVSVLDLLILRKLILSIITDFPDVPSWRFIPAGYVFPNLTDPFTPPFPETCQCVTAAGSNVTGVNFIGDKSGDVNGSATTN